MIYSSKPPFLFIHIPKTAGTSIEEALYQYQDFEINDNDIHVPMIQYREYLERDVFDKLFKFCFVRNPFDLMYSTWKYWVDGIDVKVSFEEWIIWRHEGRLSDGLKFIKNVDIDYESKLSFLGIPWYMNRSPQTYFFVDDSGVFLTDFIGCFENIEVDFNTIVNHLSLHDCFLPHANKNRVNDEKDYKQFYTDKTRKIIEHQFELDLKLFGYSFDGPNNKFTNFGFTNPNKNSIQKCLGNSHTHTYINHANLPYGLNNTIKRHVPAENYNEILKEFEIEKLTKRVSSLSINLNNIEMKIRELEYNLFNYEDGDEALLTQKNIIKEREIELVFKTKIWKIQKEIDRRKESYG